MLDSTERDVKFFSKKWKYNPKDGSQSLASLELICISALNKQQAYILSTFLIAMCDCVWILRGMNQHITNFKLYLSWIICKICLQDISTYQCAAKPDADPNSICGNVNWACFSQNYADVSAECTAQLMACCNSPSTCDSDTLLSKVLVN